jgi:hypothetical protein
MANGNFHDGAYGQKYRLTALRFHICGSCLLSTYNNSLNN